MFYQRVRMWVSCLTQVPGLPPVVGAPGHFLHTRYCPERMAARPRGRGGGKGRGRGGRGRSELARGGKGRGRGGRGRGRLARNAVLKSNARKAARKAALRQLNDLAEELGLNPVSLKRARAAEVEQLARSLQMRQLSADHAARLRASLAAWVANGGRLSAEVLDVDDPDAQPQRPLDGHRVLARGYRLESKAFMLTYNSELITADVWPSFETFTSDSARRLGARAWAACLETSQTPGRYHLHSYYFWTDGRGVRLKNLDTFVFLAATPRADVCRAGARDRVNRPAALRGLYYVAIMKRGTLAANTNYHAWTDYFPKPSWVTGWWNQHKLTHEQYLRESVLFRTGHRARQAEVDAVMEAERRQYLKRRHEEAMTVLQARRREFKPKPLQVRRWLAAFGVPDWRYAMLVLVGPSKMGKSEWAKDMRGPQKTLLVDCQNALHPDLAEFDPLRHEAVVLDEISGADFVIRNKKLLQGHVDGARLGQSPTQRYAYDISLWRVPIILTCNHWDPEVDVMRPSDRHWLLENCVVHYVNEPVWQ